MSGSPSGGGALQGVPALDLAAGEYTITPSEQQRDWDDHVGDVLSDDVEDGDEFHEYDVVDANGDFVLAVVEKKARLGDEDDLMRRIEWHHDFRTLDGDTVMTLDQDQTLHAADGSVIATWERSFPMFGKWQLLTPDGEPRGTVVHHGLLGGLIPLSRDYSYTVTGPDGGELATFDQSDVDGGLAEKLLSQMTVTVARSAIPPEVLVALGFSTHQRAQGSKAGSPPGAAGP